MLFVCLTYFTQYDNLQVHPCCCKWYYFKINYSKSFLLDQRKRRLTDCLSSHTQSQLKQSPSINSEFLTPNPGLFFDRALCKTGLMTLLLLNQLTVLSFRYLTYVLNFLTCVNVSLFIRCITFIYIFGNLIFSHFLMSFLVPERI